MTSATLQSVIPHDIMNAMTTTGNKLTDCCKCDQSTCIRKATMKVVNSFGETRKGCAKHAKLVVDIFLCSFGGGALVAMPHCPEHPTSTVDDLRKVNAAANKGA